MRTRVSKYLEKLGAKSARTKSITKHFGYSLFFKLFSVLANFLTVPLIINYLNTENYGVWLTLTSFISWFSFFDIGLGNGLRNKFAESRAQSDNTSAHAYVSTAYFSISFVTIVLLVLFVISNFFIDWTLVFNTNKNLANDLKVLMLVVFTFFCLQLVMKLIVSIYLADQNHSIQNKVQFFTQALNLLTIWVLLQLDKGSLLVFGVFYSAIPVIILIIFNYLAFRKRYSKFKPSWALFHRKYLKNIMGDGLYFFVIQIAAMVLFSTDNFIISQLFSPDQVVPYNVSFKYFSLVITAYTLLVNPFWSAFTEAFAKNDFEWIKTSVKNIQRIWLVIPLGLTLMIFCADWFYEMWVGDKVTISMKLNLSMALFVVLTTFNMVYSFFLNGIGKLKIQLYTALASICINIPLSVLLASSFDLGVSGVILATCFSVFYSTILKVIQYNKIINNRATGIWAK